MWPVSAVTKMFLQPVLRKKAYKKQNIQTSKARVVFGKTTLAYVLRQKTLPIVLAGRGSFG